MNRRKEDRPGAGTPKRSNKQLHKKRNSLHSDNIITASGLSRKKARRKLPLYPEWHSYEAEKRKLGTPPRSSDYERGISEITARGDI